MSTVFASAQVNLLRKKKPDIILTEPFTFGDWLETEECSENCKLNLRRSCDPVHVEGLTELSCEGQSLVKEGNKSCGSCGGNN